MYALFPVLKTGNEMKCKPLAKHTCCFDHNNLAILNYSSDKLVPRDRRLVLSVKRISGFCLGGSIHIKQTLIFEPRTATGRKLILFFFSTFCVFKVMLRTKSRQHIPKKKNSTSGWRSWLNNGGQNGHGFTKNIFTVLPTHKKIKRLHT